MSGNGPFPKGTLSRPFIVGLLYTAHYFPLLLVASQRNTANYPGPLIKCSHFQDQRTGKLNDDFVDIPVNRTSVGIYESKRTKTSIKFPMHDLEQFQCLESFTEERTLIWDFKYKNESASVSQRRFDTIEGGTVDLPGRAYFTTMGFLYDPVTQAFYKPNGEHCVKSVSDHNMTVNICVIKDDCQDTVFPKTYCLPKCCAIDEVMSFPSKKCVRVSKLLNFSSSKSDNNSILNAGVSPWFPPIYRKSKDIDRSFLWGVRIKQHWPTSPLETSFETSNVTYRLSKLPKNCNAVGQQKAEFKMRLHIDREQVGVSFNETVRLGVPCGEKSGQIQPMLFNKKTDAWERQNTWDYCADGYFEDIKVSMDEFYTHNDFNYVVFYCEKSGENEYLGEPCLDLEEDLQSLAVKSRGGRLTVLWVELSFSLTFTLIYCHS